MAKQKVSKAKDTDVTDKFEAAKPPNLSVPVNWDKVLDRFIKEVRKDQSWGTGAVREFLVWLSKNQSVIAEFQDNSKQYVMDEGGDLSAVFDLSVCSKCVHCTIRQVLR